MLPRLLLTLWLLAPAVHAQTQPAPATPPAAPLAPAEAQAPADGRLNQRVEHIRHEDDRVVIDELRYAGQTQSIKVKPKNGAPAYEVQPGGTRVWNVLNF